MELKSLILGILLSVGIFAVKSGVGLYYFLSQRQSLKMKTVWVMLYYGLIFFIFHFSANILKKVDFLQHVEAMQTFFKSGMTMHVILAGLLAIWGVGLLKRGEDHNRKNLRWLAMVIPCPVCLGVILVSIAFLLAYFPDADEIVAMWACAGFLAINLLTMTALKIWRSQTGSTHEQILGMAMLFIAVYFLLSFILIPQFSDLDTVYRLARYTGDTGGAQGVSMACQVILYAVAAISFAAGFRSTRRKIWSTR
jgi:predicted transporter